MRRTNVLVTGLIAALAGLMAGCASNPPAADQQVLLPAPKIEPEPRVVVESTILERFQEICSLHAAEKARAEQLAGLLDEQTTARQKAEIECAQLRSRLADLEPLVNEVAALKTKCEEAQKAALELENSVRELRRDLLQARLASAKQEQTILAYKIDRAMERRRQPTLGISETPAVVQAPDAQTPKDAPPDAQIP